MHTQKRPSHPATHMENTNQRKVKDAPKGIGRRKKFRRITKVSLFSESFYPADDPRQMKTNGEQP